MVLMSRRVLVVDDHPAVALAMKLAFRADGRFELAGSAATAAEGLAQAAGKDAVLLDLHLPDLSGPELVAAFRARAPGVPLILHSAADETPAVAAVRDLVDAVTLKSDIKGVLAALARLTAA
jgi:DNA-binding NarL/FixJ family response regulator